MSADLLAPPVDATIQRLSLESGPPSLWLVYDALRIIAHGDETKCFVQFSPSSVLRIDLVLERRCRMVISEISAIVKSEHPETSSWAPFFFTSDPQEFIVVNLLPYLTCDGRRYHKLN